MIRTLAALAAFAALPAIAAAQTSYNDPVGGVVVQAQPRDAYVITINTLGKDEPTVRQEIWDAAYTACNRAPRTGDALDIRVEATQACVSQAAWDANAQFDQILDQRRSGYSRYYYGDQSVP